MNIYVGNLSYEVTEEDMRQAFGAYGEVTATNIIKDKFTNRSRGFGFVEMPNGTEAEKAINELNGKDLKGRPLTVNEARPRTEGGSSNGNSRGRSNGGGDRGGRGGQSRRSW